jgi:hypothetical protein
VFFIFLSELKYILRNVTHAVYSRYVAELNKMM